MTGNEEGWRTVGEVADLLTLSVRTLHHWEERGLAVASERSWSNYRLYSEADVARLQQIMIYRATGMSLDAIAELFEAGDAVVHLRHQRDLLMKKESELHRMVEAVDKLLEEAMSTNRLSVEEVAQILGDAEFPTYQAEAEQQWESTDDWKTSAQTTARMGRADWEALRENTDQVEAALVAAMRRGVEPGTPEADALAEQHRALLSEFFPVSHAKHTIISRGYIEDPRFNAYYEKRAEGLAEWLKAIIDANAAHHGVHAESARWE